MNVWAECIISLCCSQIPVPVFLPTTLQSAEHIVKTIDELKAKVPTDPLEADLIAMAEMIAEEDKKPECLGVNLFLETAFVVFLSSVTTGCEIKYSNICHWF